MQNIARLSLILVFLGLTAIQPVAQNKATLSRGRVTEVENLIKTTMSEAKIPGLSGAIISENQLSYMHGFGTANLENATPATPTTAYRLGSLTKTITAVGVMRLAEQGKLELDAPVQKYCPAFPAKQWTVTARKLLAHLGGVRDYNNQKFLEEYFSTRNYSSVRESLSIFKDDPLLSEPGTKYTYSTYGFVLLCCAIEGAANTTYESYIRENILKPAGLTDTGVDDIFQIIPNRAGGYGKTRSGVVRNTAFADTSNKIPAGGLISTAPDMGKFYLALQGGALISQATLAQIWTVQKTRDGQQVSYGLGWNRRA
jgi:CubicO group peptidase (beta-lactamase class C family)